MRNRVIVTFVTTLAIGLAAYMLYPVGMPDETAEIITRPSGDQGGTSKGPPARQPSTPAEDIPPPPSPKPGTSVVPPPEVRRTLTGMTEEQVARIESHLPAGARVYLSPVGRDQARPAVIDTDLEGGGTAETVVVYSTRPPTAGEPSPALFLGVLTQEGQGMRIKSTTALNGGVLFNVTSGGVDLPVVARDMTGDGRAEIIVSCGGGASVGGKLMIFRRRGESLEDLAGDIYGHHFTLQQGPQGSAVVKALDKSEDKERSYKWDGRKFNTA
jgi:hypothetical protein